MAEHLPLDLPEDGKLSQNITWFARALRKAGLPVGPGRVIEAIRAVEAAGFTDRRDFYWTLHACFVSRPEHATVFAQIFRLYWRDPRYMEHMMAMLVPAVRGVQEDRPAAPAEKRAAEALLADQADRPVDPAQPEETEVEIDASATASGDEKLRALDFEQMSTAEMARARHILSQMSLPVPPVITRRLVADRRGRAPDWRRTLRGALARGGEVTEIRTRARATRWPNLVALCDISGSMSQYSRAILHFLHAVSNREGQGWARVHGFTFGTRLTNITRHLADRDVDAALQAAGREARDWEGGTRIGACLAEFNRDWSRRVLGQGAVVLLITDGLERDDPARLAAQMERLHLSCRHLIWLNPLLRWDGFAPRAQGVAAMLPHVDSFRAGHNIAALEGLAAALSDPRDHGERARLMAMLS
ncbi:von Willebrand factor A [Roseovarius sp. 22II1-1F6A]|nr:von Willebrand factor A [Roseovarius sp. 22II1-1F6A]